MKIITTAVGKPRTTAIDIPLFYEIKVSRDDGYGTSQPEILAALTLAIESMMSPKKKKRAAPQNEVSE